MDILESLTKQIIDRLRQDIADHSVVYWTATSRSPQLMMLNAYHDLAMDTSIRLLLLVALCNRDDAEEMRGALIKFLESFDIDSALAEVDRIAGVLRENDVEQNDFDRAFRAMKDKFNVH